jgi:hypothetical protein
MEGIKVFIVKNRSRRQKMKTIYSLAVLIIAIALFAWKKDSQAAKPAPQTQLNGTWYGKYKTTQDSTQKAFVIVLREKGKMDVYEGDIATGDKAKGTFMINGTKLFGNFQFIQDGPITNIEADLNATKDIMSGAWYCGNDGGAFVADKPLTHSAALQPGSPKQPL